MANQEFHKTASHYFGPSVWAKTILLHFTKMDYSKHPPKMANQEFHKTALTTFRPSFAFFRRKYKPLHNGKDDMVSTQTHHIIKVRFAK
jgi:hypothetical protein